MVSRWSARGRSVCRQVHSYMSKSGHQVYPTTGSPLGAHRCDEVDGVVEPLDALGDRSGDAGLGDHDGRAVPRRRRSASTSRSPSVPASTRRARVGEAAAVVHTRLEHLGRVPRVVVDAHHVRPHGVVERTSRASSSLTPRRRAGGSGCAVVHPAGDEVLHQVAPAGAAAATSSRCSAARCRPTKLMPASTCTKVARVAEPLGDRLLASGTNPRARLAAIAAKPAAPGQIRRPVARTRRRTARG